jgi:hypothetical protein
VLRVEQTQLVFAHRSKRHRRERSTAAVQILEQFRQRLHALWFESEFLSWRAHKVHTTSRHIPKGSLNLAGGDTAAMTLPEHARKGYTATVVVECWCWKSASVICSNLQHHRRGANALGSIRGWRTRRFLTPATLGDPFGPRNRTQTIPSEPQSESHFA